MTEVEKTKDRSIYNSIIRMLGPIYRELSKHYLDFFKDTELFLSTDCPRKLAAERKM